jgi:protein-S-isoprenylcysteine O-methyltransferase Ste14
MVQFLRDDSAKATEEDMPAMNEVNSLASAATEERTDARAGSARDGLRGHASDGTSPDVVESRDAEQGRTSRLVPIGNFFFKYRNIVAPVVLCGSAVASKPLVVAGNRRLDMYLDIVGIAMILAGQLLRFCVIGFAYIKRGGKQKQVYADTLVQEGFFAHCRNPLYVGNVLALLGLIVIHSGVLMYAVCLPFFLFLYWSIVVAEENYLRKKFGHVYNDYAKRVPRFWISFRGLGHTLRGMQYNWKKVVRKEYGTTFVFATSTMALLVWKRVAADGFEATRGYLSFMLVLWVPVVVAYLIAFAAKKTGLLGKG